MIVVIGSPAYRPPDGGPGGGAGPVFAIAAAAAAAGGTVELLGRVGEDPAGEALVLALAAARVGHVALLRDAGRPTPVVAARPEGESERLRPDPEGDLNGDLREAVLLALAEPEAASPARVAGEPTLDAADLELGLRYLGDFRVVVVAEPLDAAAAAVVRDAAAFCSAQVVLVVEPGATGPAELVDATVLESPVSDPDGRFAGLVGAYAAELDGGRAPGEAFRAAIDRIGWEPAPA